MHYWESITFESPQILSILGFKGIGDGTGYHIGYKCSSQIHIPLTEQKLVSDYPVDISSDIQLMFVYLDIIHHHIVGDAKAPLLRVLVTNRRVKTVACVLSNQVITKFSLTSIIKKLLVKNIQNVAVNIRTETGRLVPSAGAGGKVVLTLKLKQISS